MDDKAMLTGKNLGAAIREAIRLKGVSKVEVASAFKVKPPSVQGWMNNGAISKEKLPKLWDYFGDVVGPEHWGMEPIRPSVVYVPRPSPTTPRTAAPAAYRATVNRAGAALASMLDDSQRMRLLALMDAILSEPELAGSSLDLGQVNSWFFANETLSNAEGLPEFLQTTDLHSQLDTHNGGRYPGEIGNAGVGKVGEERGELGSRAEGKQRTRRGGGAAGGAA